jgi:small nuclear ribonucleoprotein (snRNP)-like protein
MPAEDPLDRLLDDLEGQAEGLYLADRAVEVAELGVAQYAEVELAGRWQASVDRPLRVVTTDGWDMRGRLVRAAADWVVLSSDEGGAWAVHLRSVALVTGLADRTVPAEARPLSARLSLGSLLRRLAGEASPVSLRLVGGRIVRGRLTRVGADFAEVRADGGEATVVAFGALVAVRL